MRNAPAVRRWARGLGSGSVGEAGDVPGASHPGRTKCSTMRALESRHKDPRVRRSHWRAHVAGVGPLK